jgi:hypothetical protein
VSTTDDRAWIRLDDGDARDDTPGATATTSRRSAALNVTKTHVIPQEAVILDIWMRCDRAGRRGDLRLLRGAVFSHGRPADREVGPDRRHLPKHWYQRIGVRQGILRLIEVMGAAPSGSSTVRLRSSGSTIKGLELSLKDRTVEERRGSLVGHFQGT